MRIHCVTFDCADPERLAEFWARALGYEPHGHRCHPPNGIGPYLEFVKVPERKTVKNRVHLGAAVPDLDAEIARLTSLGATVAWQEEFPPHFRYRNVVLRDPEGNEFCLSTATRTVVDAVAADLLAVLGDVVELELPGALRRRVEQSVEQLQGVSFLDL